MKMFPEFDDFDAVLDYKNKLAEYKKKRKLFESVVKGCVIALVMSVLLLIVPQMSENLNSIYLKSSKYPFSLFVFNVGSGNCVLLHSDECNVLIDCGRELVQFEILDVFNYLDIDKLDLMILTHPDKDHIGNMADVAKHIEINRFITCENGDYELTELYEDLLSVLDSTGIEIEYAKAGDNITFGDVALDIVSPTKVYDNSNNNSVVVKVSFRGFTALLPGDVGKAAERDIVDRGIDLSADVLLTAHHGSGSSTTDEFLEAVNPEYALISVYQSDYLPSDKTLRRLLEHGCDILRTDESGSIMVAVNENGEFGFYTEYGRR